MTRFLSKFNIQVYVSKYIIFILALAILISACSEEPMKSEIVLIEEGDYMYPAKVTKAYAAKDAQIHVYIFNDKIREKIGALISNNKIATKRTIPPKGWGTRQLALQYFWNDEWIYAENVTEFEDYYIVPVNDGKDKKIELKHIRFPIPIQR